MELGDHSPGFVPCFSPIPFSIFDVGSTPCFSFPGSPLTHSPSQPISSSSTSISSPPRLSQIHNLKTHIEHLGIKSIALILLIRCPNRYRNHNSTIESLDFGTYQSEIGWRGNCNSSVD
ncbi:hypothetical protein Droror1_Dr00004047 [Drosera rotundifolia]